MYNRFARTFAVHKISGIGVSMRSSVACGLGSKRIDAGICPPQDLRLEYVNQMPMGNVTQAISSIQVQWRSPVCSALQSLSSAIGIV